MPLSGNKGEWSEIYIFLKLLHDGRIYAADKDMNRLETVYLNILKILREEVPGTCFEYIPGTTIEVWKRGEGRLLSISPADVNAQKEELWELLRNSRGAIESPNIERFLNSIYIFRLKAPAFSNSEFFGGTEDIAMEIMDYRTGISSVVGFSCKSDFAQQATLFNASADNTNFTFEITNIDDEIADRVNGLYKTVHRNGEVKNVISTAKRMKELKNCGAEIRFAGQPVRNAQRDLVISGGIEMPSIVAEMLKFYYWEHNGEVKYSSITKALEYAIEKNPVGYEFGDLRSIYRAKVGNLLYDMFTGMRLSQPWDGNSNVSGGYIIAKEDGDVLAYHTTLANEFKDFLIEKLAFETPSCGRHNAMKVFKVEGRYFINLNLQIRFAKKSATTEITQAEDDSDE